MILISIPKNIQMRGYQKDAVRAWFNHDGCGIFEMATGSGKTITGLCGMIKLLEQFHKANIPCGMVLVLPYKVLLEQWVEVLKDFGINPQICYESKNIWKNKLHELIRLFNQGSRDNLFIVTTNRTFYSDEFQSELNRIEGVYIFCVDEMHHFATDQAVALLPEKAHFRLGLSATLMSHWNDEGMQKLKDYFVNGVVYEFTLERAIREGFLTPYYYHPVFVELTPDEKSEYFELSAKIGKALVINKGSFDNEILQNLMFKRARLITSAENKIEILRAMSDKIIGTRYNLFYCGDQKEANERYVDKVNKVLSFEFNLKSHTFTSTEDKNTREFVLDRFAQGEIEAITAIRCLDEGIDIPQLRRAFILSSGTNPKEFIQRRGRILRRSPGKDSAEIYDFFVVPTLDPLEIQSLDTSELNIERKILNREFERFKEFADLALNKQNAYQKIIAIWELYNQN